MHALEQAFAHGDVPLPLVLGWRRQGDLTFICMSLVRGQTLRRTWNLLTLADKRLI